MTTPDPQLAELADLAMDLAREMAKRAKQAEGNSEAVALVAAFERAARSVRLCKLVQQRLQETVARIRREDHDRLLDRRTKQVKAALSQEIDSQGSLAQAVRLHRQLSERLEHDRLFDTLSLGPVEAHIARLRQKLGLPEPAPSPYLPREAAGGGPRAEHSEERVVEGASPTHGASSSPSCDGDAADPHEPHERGLVRTAAADSS